ncbi:UvrB/UvrC motif-containing protein [uncultured Veillonella sp.]|uniref:UvrB/UvrC motif-containing protein n=1 Tax=uncultured Veillonella sp. TaxID=159268 RepID=UPI0025DC3871|nr:UvrB/UvrC motif-containing protein [uncultured Veillonella sp.]MDY3973317.1 UvrB/UvrC motif-containing protein [Veillonella caviae]
MICDECKKNEASVHLTRVVNGKKTERHLCSQCAGKQSGDGLGNSFFSFGSPLLDNDFFTNDFFTNSLYPDSLLHSHQAVRCDRCGMSFDEFNHSGKFGCDHCYDVFNAQITPLVKRLQGSLAYEGRVPSRGTGVFKTKHQIKRLRQELDKSIKAEQFEEAARLRDEIKVLEESLQHKAE